MHPDGKMHFSGCILVLTFDISIFIADRECVFGAHQPADPLAHQEQRAIALLVAHVVHL